MTTVLQVRDRAIQADELIPLLQDYQLLPKLRRELAIDEAIVAVTCTPQEQEMLSKQFFAQQNIPVDADQQFYRDRYGMTSEQMLAPLIRGLRIEKFKRAKWGMKLELYFLKRKADLDRVMFSLIRHPNRELMQELYFRLVEGEQSFTELAILYSQGVEAQTQGIFGPIELGQLHPILAKLLITSQPG
ncbi:MAG: peptidylprolyl isomerase, partial [Microcystaceae cyanobacterium]